MKRYQMSRRALLRGLGVSMALPWMESIRVWGDESDGGDVSSSAPTRMAVLFSGCGFHSKEWWARGQGKAMELGKVLQPLENFKEQMVFIRGLYNAEALKGNIHSSQTGNLLSGAPLASGGDIRSGTSVDQFVAQSLGTQTKLPSLVLGCEKSNPLGGLPGACLRSVVQGFRSKGRPKCLGRGLGRCRRCTTKN